VTHPLSAWLSAFLFTQAVEIPIYLLAFRLDRPTPEGSRLRPLGARIGVAFGASAITHPFVWFAFPALLGDDYWLMVACAEAFAVTGEAIYFHLLGVERAFAWSLLANASSAGLGLASRTVFGWP
jgi:hypothetical protein